MTTTTGAPVRRPQWSDIQPVAAIGFGAGIIAFALAVLVSNPVAYVIGVPIAALATLAIVRDWRIGVILAAASLPLGGVVAPGVSGSIFRLIAAITTVSVGVRLASDRALRERLGRLVRTQLVVVLAAYLGWMALSMLWAPRSDLWTIDVVALAGFALLVALTALVDRRTIGVVWAALLLASVIAIPLAPLFAESAEHITDFRRLSIGGGNPNGMAVLLAIAIGVAIVRKYQTSTGRLLSILAILILGSAVVLTGSRSGTVALISVCAGSVLVVLLGQRDDATGPRSVRAGRNLLLWASGTVLFLAVVFLALNRVDLGFDVEELAEQGGARISTLAQIDAEVDLAGREQIWPVMFASVQEHPIIGVGAGNAEVVSLYAGVYRGSDDTRGAGPHNTFLETVVEGGLIGGALYAAVWIIAVAYLVALWRRSDPLAGPLTLGVLAWAVAGLALTLGDEKVAALLLGSILAAWLSHFVPTGDERQAA